MHTQGPYRCKLLRKLCRQRGARDHGERGVAGRPGDLLSPFLKYWAQTPPPLRATRTTAGAGATAVVGAGSAKTRALVVASVSSVTRWPKDDSTAGVVATVTDDAAGCSTWVAAATTALPAAGGAAAGSAGARLNSGAQLNSLADMLRASGLLAAGG